MSLWNEDVQLRQKFVFMHYKWLSRKNSSEVDEMRAYYRNVSFINKSRVLVICCRNTVLFSFADGPQKLCHFLIRKKPQWFIFIFYLENHPRGLDFLTSQQYLKISERQKCKILESFLPLKTGVKNLSVWVNGMSCECLAQPRMVSYKWTNKSQWKGWQRWAYGMVCHEYSC